MIPACDQKHCTPPTTTACAVMMRSGYNNGGLLGVSTCSVFVMNSLILLEYTDCFLWYLVFVSNFGMCYICTLSYRIVLRAYRYTYRSLCIGDIPVCRCIVSALSITMNIQSALWILMARCFSTRASVATVLSIHLCISNCLWVKQYEVTEPHKSSWCQLCHHG